MHRSPKPNRPSAAHRPPARSGRADRPEKTSLAYSIGEAAALILEVIDGRNLTEAWERALSRNRDWTDGIRGAVRDLTWNTLRDFGRGDAVLSQLLTRPLPDAVRAVLLVALTRLEARPDDAYTIVDQAVEAVGVFAPGMKGVANGVLRNRLRRSGELNAALATDPSYIHCHPIWWIERLRAQHPASWEAILEAGNTHPPMSLRPNSGAGIAEALIDALSGCGIDARRVMNGAVLLDAPVPVSRVPGFAEGAVSVQDAGAQLAAHYLGARPGMRVLDACSAPGGKTAHILECADVDMTALDIDDKRLGRVRDNLSRLGLSARTLVGDARRPSDWWDGVAYDRILADVPCSASGVVRRHPDIKWLRRDDDLARFAAQQREILDALWQTLAAGGTMLYATCSVFEEENRNQVEGFCARHGDVERLPLDGQIDRQLLPNAEHDGFYYAALRKRG